MLHTFLLSRMLTDSSSDPGLNAGCARLAQCQEHLGSRCLSLCHGHSCLGFLQLRLMLHALCVTAVVSWTALCRHKPGLTVCLVHMLQSQQDSQTVHQRSTGIAQHLISCSKVDVRHSLTLASPCPGQGLTLRLSCRQGCLKLDDASSSCLDGCRLLLLQPAQLSLGLLCLLLQAMPAGMRAMHKDAHVMDHMLPGRRA